MTNRSVTPPGKRDTARTGAKNAPPPGNPRISRPLAEKPAPKRDLFGIYFLVGATVLILLFGAGVFFLRSNRGTVAAPTATPTILAVSTLPVPEALESPIPNFTPPPIPTLANPDALNSGAFVQGDALTSQVGTPDPNNAQQIIPPQIPQPVLQLSQDAVDWGAVTDDQKPTSTIILANPASGNLIIRELWVDCSCVVAQVEGKTMKSGERTRLNITYSPTADTAQDAIAHKLYIVSTDGQHPIVEIPLSAAR